MQRGSVVVEVERDSHREHKEHREGLGLFHHGRHGSCIRTCERFELSLAVGI